jgi:hypothetical protein
MLEKKIFDYERCAVVKEITGIDVMKLHENEVAEKALIEKEKQQAQNAQGATASIPFRV